MWNVPMDYDELVEKIILHPFAGKREEDLTIEQLLREAHEIKKLRGVTLFTSPTYGYAANFTIDGKGWSTEYDECPVRALKKVLCRIYKLSSVERCGNDEDGV